jgi:hypothetical protein
LAWFAQLCAVKTLNSLVAAGFGSTIMLESCITTILKACMLHILRQPIQVRGLSVDSSSGLCPCPGVWFHLRNGLYLMRLCLAAVRSWSAVSC